MERYLETLFRFAWLFLLMLVATSASGAAYVVSQRTALYQTRATVWADRPAYLTTLSEWNQWASAAANEASSINELLQTQSFDVQVLQRTSYRDRLKTDDGQQKAIKNLKRRVSVFASSDHVVNVVANDEQPNVAIELATAIIDASNQEMLKQANSSSTLALDFYQKQLDAANVKLTDATTALQSYLNAHPELTAPLPGRPETLLSSAVGDSAFAARYPELVKLSQQRDSAEKDAQSLQTQVLQIRFAQSSYSTSSNQSFRVMDPPGAPALLIDSKKGLATKLAIVALPGLALMLGALVLLTLLDTTLRSDRGAAQRLQLPVLSTLPYIRERRGLFRRSRLRQRSVSSLLVLDAQTPRLGETAGQGQS